MTLDEMEASYTPTSERSCDPCQLVAGVQGPYEAVECGNGIFLVEDEMTGTIQYMKVTARGLVPMEDF